jgi:hypothetical protein
MLAAILLPIPFAALPVIVVLIGAVSGGSNSDSGLVTRESTVSSLQNRLKVAVTESDGSTLAKVSEPAQGLDGCGGDSFVDF